MFFARHAKQQRAERDSNDALAKGKSHNALAQLSVSGVARKHESAGVVAAFVSNAGASAYNGIERRGRGVTIRRGGPHGQTERLERSLRSHSAFYRHIAVFCVDLLHAILRKILSGQ